MPRYTAEIITAEGNFHGRTIAAISISTEAEYREDFGPFTPGFISVPYGDAQAIERAITANTAAVLIEPIQGEGGVIMPPPAYLRLVSEACAYHKVLFIADEIQTGLGRTGRLFACQHEAVRPDMTIIGKALSADFCRSRRCLPIVIFWAYSSPANMALLSGEIHWRPQWRGLHYRSLLMKR